MSHGEAPLHGDLEARLKGRLGPGAAADHDVTSTDIRSTAVRKALSWSKAWILLAAAVARLEAAWGTPQNDVRGSPALTRKPVFLAYPLEVSHEVRRYAPAGLRAAADRLARPLLFRGIGEVPANPFMPV